MSEFSTPSVDSSINPEVLENLVDNLGRPLSNERVLKNFKNEKDKLIVEDLLDRIYTLGNKTQKLESQVEQLQEEKFKRQAFSYANNALRCQLQGFFCLAYIVTIIFVVADTCMDFYSFDTTEQSNLYWVCGLRGAGILIIIICAYLSWKSFRNNEKQAGTILHENESDN